MLAMAALSGFVMLIAIRGLAAPGHSEQPAAAIEDSQLLYLLGVLSLLAVAVLDVVIGAALYRVFRPVSISLARLAAGLRVVYAVIFLTAIGALVGLVGIAEVLDGIETFELVWKLGLVLFGLHLLLVGHLSCRSRHIPRILGVLVALAGLGYVVDSLTFLLPDLPMTAVGGVTVVGEFLFPLWLLICAGRPGAWGRNRRRHRDRDARERPSLPVRCTQSSLPAKG